MTTSSVKAGQKPWIKTDQDLLIIKQGEITTGFGQKQTYKLRVVRWGRFQGVIEKRLFRYNKMVLDYVPGRALGLNAQDFQALIERKDEILELLYKTKPDALAYLNQVQQRAKNRIQLYATKKKNKKEGQEIE